MSRLELVDADALSKIFEFNHDLFMKQRNEFIEQRRRIIGSMTQYDLAAHRKFIQKTIEINNISMNCIVKLDSNDGPHKIIDPPSTHFSLPKLAVTFRKIDFNFKSHQTDFMYLPSLDHQSQTESGIKVIFLDCTFTGNRDKNQNISCILFGNSVFQFDNCKFHCVDLFAVFHGTAFGTFELTNCEMNSNELIIRGKNIDKITGVGGHALEHNFSLNGEYISKVYAAFRFEDILTNPPQSSNLGQESFRILRTLKDARDNILMRIERDDCSSIGIKELCQILLYDSLRLRVSPDQVKIKVGNSPKIIISNSIIDTIIFFGKGNFRFTGKNRFSRLVGGNLPSTIYWGGGQNFDVGEKNLFDNRDFFLNLKSNRETQQDAYQTLVVQKELAKCHHALLHLEGTRASLQDRMIFGFSRLVSYHGTSWIRTLTLIALLNLVVFLLFATAETFSNSTFGSFIDFVSTWLNADGLNIYLELFNPIKRASLHFSIQGWYATLLDWFHKIFYGLLAYELVKTLRRFGRASS